MGTDDLLNNNESTNSHSFSSILRDHNVTLECTIRGKMNFNWFNGNTWIMCNEIEDVDFEAVPRVNSPLLLSHTGEMDYKLYLHGVIRAIEVNLSGKEWRNQDINGTMVITQSTANKLAHEDLFKPIKVNYLQACENLLNAFNKRIVNDKVELINKK